MQLSFSEHPENPKQTQGFLDDTGSATKFSHFLINKMKEWNCPEAVISLEKETDEKMLSQLSQFVDKVIEVK